jgi:hypothetical protein
MLLGLSVLGLSGSLLVPAAPPPVPTPADARPFVWDEDELWRALEAEFDATRSGGCAGAAGRIDAGLAALAHDVEWLEAGDRSARDARLDALETNLFAVAPLVAACPATLPTMLDLVNRLRAAMKRNSRSWDIRDEAARERVYRTLYGARMTAEEVLLQRDPDDVPDLVLGADVASKTPSVVVEGLRVHSGDILVSRGGAPVSALIARGNDYPGNFSHIALLHVSEQGDVSIIEAHIEVGTAVSTLEQYLADKKLRIMVLRLDDSLESLRADPLLPHRAATAALAEARGRHIPYDFAMHYQEPTEKFCSEVASAPYADLGVVLWEGLTTMSSRGTTAWLAALGVEQFETLGPSDLEYDPKVVVVGEWRNRATLFDDHVDNAVIDAMLEAAEGGKAIDYDYRDLPMARLAKAYSLVLNAVGRPGPVPEGMDATTALRSRWLADQHGGLRAGVLKRADAFRTEYGYEPPYWQLVEMARAELAVSAEFRTGVPGATSSARLGNSSV